MKRIDFEAQIDHFNDFYYRQLFERFAASVHNSPYKLKTCPFNFVYSFFSYSKIDKRTAREIVKHWTANDWCQRAKYHGLKLKGELSG
ncbi:MAG: hypothetical protein J4428_05170 [Candidatus Aenigmarchaeota archaeon]|nr:hypothetical protein [Candidatus Aenigmarchaeota archaeon]